MSVDQRNLPSYFSNNADFQAWIQGIHAQLTAIGMVQTADTGQINPATAVLPSAGNNAGYSIWRLNDSLQSTNPVFLKLEFGNTISSNTRPSLWITAGSSTNGAGSLPAPNTGRQQTASQGTTSASSTAPSYASGDGSWAGIFTNTDTVNKGLNCGFILDRIRDGSGTPTGEGYVLAFLNTNGAPAAVSVQGNLTAATAGNSASGAQGVFPGPTSVNGGNAAALGGGFRVLGQSFSVMPCMVLAAQLRYLKCGVIYSMIDIGSVSEISFPAYNLGATHNYRTVPIPSFAWGAHGNDYLALLWE